MDGLPASGWVGGDGGIPSPRWGEGQGEGASMLARTSMLRSYARRLRRDQTDAERVLWSHPHPIPLPVKERGKKDPHEIRKSRITKDPSERGTVLLGAVAIMLILSMLGTLSLNLATHEIEGTKAILDEAVAQHLAEAGSDLIMQWFHDPGAIPAASAGLFVKRHDVPGVGPSFFDANGISQFTGSAERADVVYDSSNPADDRLLNDANTGLFRPLGGLGRITRLKVYGPSRPGLLCTAEVTAAAGGQNSGSAPEVSRTVSVQFGARTIPPLRAGVQISQMSWDAGSPLPEVQPVWAHWGTLKVKGPARFGKTGDLPVKSAMAPVTRQSYAEMSRREDRWFEIWVGGEVFFADAPPLLPANVYAQRDPVPGLNEDRWDYDTMKKQALLYGSYYARGRDGLLYRNGNMTPGTGLSAEEAFGSKAVGEHHGLVFVDTLDQAPPRPDNLGTVTLETEYAEGLFIFNAHVVLKPKGPGKSVPALSPPDGASTSLGARIPVELTGIHLRGVLSVAGDLSFEGQPRLYGGLLAAGRVISASGNSSQLEVWYDHDLRSGVMRGMQLVYLAPGTWREHY